MGPGDYPGGMNWETASDQHERAGVRSQTVKGHDCYRVARRAQEGWRPGLEAASVTFPLECLICPHVLITKLQALCLCPEDWTQMNMSYDFNSFIHSIKSRLESGQYLCTAKD